MPAVTRWFLKLSLVYLFLALVLQGLLLAPGVPLSGWLAGMAPVYFHLFMVGWVTQMIFGVAHWMFPKWSRERPRGHEGLAWASLLLLNTGLLLRAVGEPSLAVGRGDAWKIAVALSALLQALAGLAFVANTWRRVRGR